MKLRAVGIAAAFLLSGLILVGGLYAVGTLVLWPGTSPSTGELVVLQSATILAASAGLTWLFATRFVPLSATDLRWWPSGAGDLLRGVLFGAAPAVAALVLGLLAGGRWTADGGTFGAWLASLVRLLALLAPAALAEELVFRGLPLVVLARAFGAPTAIVLLALPFGLTHGLNPGATPLAVGNVVLAGVFLGAVFYLPGGLWTATGAHLGWNLALAGLAAPVSGLPVAVPGLDYEPGASTWLTGGAFGPEGGLLATLTLAAAAVLAARPFRRESTE